jgi:uncharacterized protein (DUF58 family)
VIPLRAARSPKLTAYLLLGSAAMLAALATGHGELMAVGVPFLLVLTWTLTIPRPALSGTAAAGPDLLTEGGTVTTEVELQSRGTPHRMELRATLVAATGEVVGYAVETLPLSRRRVATALEVGCPQLGRYGVPSVDLFAEDAFGVLAFTGHIDLATTVRVYPASELLPSPPAPRHTQLRTGNHRSRARGDGIEYAGTREFVPGDHIRRVNARLSSRSASLQVNEHVPERNTDIVLLLDTFTDLREAGRSSLAAAAHAVAGLADVYLAERDRVGFAEFGGIVRWLLPASGRMQLARILEALLDARLRLHYAWTGIDRLPPQLLPPNAFVIAVSPLIDGRTRQLVLDLWARRRDTAVVELSPLAFMPTPTGRKEALARRAWIVERRAERRELRSLGIAVGEWTYGEPLVSVMQDLEHFRRASAVHRR